MDISIFSSVLDNLACTKNSLSWKFLFSEHRDNTFSLDGEEIKRPCDMPVADALDGIKSRLSKSVPNTEERPQVLKNKSSLDTETIGE